MATGNVHSHNRRRARLQDALVAVRRGETLEESEPRRRGNRSSALARPGGDGRALRRAPRGGRRDRAPRRAAALRPDHRARLPLPAARTRRRPRAGRALPGAARRALRRQRRTGARPKRRLDEELATIRHLGLSGFFLLHHELLELAREVAVEVRGRDSAALGAAAGARARLQRQLDRLLPDRPLPHRPGRRTNLFSGRFLNDEIDLDAGHRPRLPARHPRGADPARPRGLRRRPLGPGRRLPDLPPARRRPRPRQGAGAAAGGDREGREDGRLPRVGRRDRSATSSPRSAPSAPPRRAGGRCSGSARTRWACPATPPSTPAGW